jgi:hypothetical protein
VGVDDVEGFAAGDFSGQRGVALNFGEQIAAVVANWDSHRRCRALRSWRPDRCWRASGARRFRLVAPVVVMVEDLEGGCRRARPTRRLIRIGQLGIDGSEGDAFKFVESQLGVWRCQGRTGTRG